MCRLTDSVEEFSGFQPDTIELPQAADFLQLTLRCRSYFDVWVFHRCSGAGMGDVGSVPQDVFGGFEVGQKLVSVEFDVVDFGTGVILFDQLANPETIEFRVLIWGGGRWASRAWGFRTAGVAPP